MRRRTAQLGVVAVIASAAVLLGVGAATGRWDRPSSRPLVDPADVQPVDAASLDAVCGGVSLQGHDLDDLPDATTLGEAHVAALTEAEMGTRPRYLVPRWKVLRADDERVELLRFPDRDGSDGHVHSFIVVGRHPDGDAWVPYSSGQCEPEVRLPEPLGGGRFAVAEQPAAGDAAVELLVSDGGCSSGQSATDRVVVLEQEQSADELRLLLGVVPLRGAQTCPGVPPSPFTLELARPAATDLAVVDLSLVPPRPAPVGPFDPLDLLDVP